MNAMRRETWSIEGFEHSSGWRIEVQVAQVFFAGRAGSALFLTGHKRAVHVIVSRGDTSHTISLSKNQDVT